MSSKLEEGDFKGAVRLACSEDTLAEPNEATFSALREKHPSPPPGSNIPPPPPVVTPLSVPVSEADVAQAIRSFPNGSAGGPDGLRPQHLKDLIAGSDQTPPSLLPWLPFPLWSLRAELLFLFVPFFWSLPDCSKQEGWWDTAYCSGLYSTLVSCQVSREDGGGGNGKPFSSSAAGIWSFGWSGGSSPRS